MPDPVLVPVVTKNSNAREHWATRARRVKAERATTALALMQLGRWRPALPCIVLLVRRGPNLMDVGDNLAGAAKAIRDEIAKWLGIDDRDDRVTWIYGQEVTKRRTKTAPAEPQGTRIEFR